jgi:hypothetical protein
LIVTFSIFVKKALSLKEFAVWGLEATGSNPSPWKKDFKDKGDIGSASSAPFDLNKFQHFSDLSWNFSH